jgi:Xaa-Pro aminopeptidase
MVITVEPGLYIRPAANIPEAFWNIGIRIEDDAVITAQGCDLISRGVPVLASEIERTMRESK